jgi:hypothetical protein
MISDESAVTCARIARAFDSLLSASMARLRLHYAARISALVLAGRGEQTAAVAALASEHDAALEQLRHASHDRRREALRFARRRSRQKRMGVVFEPVQPERPCRPARSDRERRSSRAASTRYPKP